MTKIIKPATLGDVKKHPVLIPLSEIFNENVNIKYFNAYACLLNEYRTVLKDLDNLSKSNKLYLYNLIKKDTLSRLDMLQLPDILYSHSRNFIISIYRNHLSNLKHYKQGVKKNG